MTLTLELGKLIADAHNQPISDKTLHQAALTLADTVGVMLAGRREKAVTQLAQTQRCLAGEASPDSLAWALRAGTAAHALDYDNVALGGHPGAVLIPSLLTLARRFDLTGRRLLIAFTVGYEVWGELRRRHPVLAHAAGWHPSGLIGPVAAAAACASALGLDAVQAQHALAISASQSAGLMANFGTPVKALHIGFAAQAGLLAALLARHGVTGNKMILEQENGWLATWSPHHAADRTSALAWPHQGWLLGYQPPAIKYYPLCYAAHRVIDAARQLRHTLAARLADISQIRIFTSQRHSDILRFRQPENRTQCCFSLEFAVASALCDGEVTLSSLQDEWRQRETIERLMSCCERQVSPVEDPEREGFAQEDWVEVITRQGEKFASQPVRYATGDPHIALSDGQLRNKFNDCLQRGGISQGISELWHELMLIDGNVSVATLSLYPLLEDPEEDIRPKMVVDKTYN